MTRNCTIRATARLLRAGSTAMFLCVFLVALVPAGEATTAGFQVIYQFTGGTDGEFPEGGLTFEPGLTVTDNQIVGTTYGSLGEPGIICTKSCGNTYAIKENQPPTPGYPFGQNPNDGAFPTGDVVVQNGITFGITEFGGGTSCNGLGCGTVFAVQGQTELHKFQFCVKSEYPVCANGAIPRGGPILGMDGNLYGTTTLGGVAAGYKCDSDFGGCGTVYELPPDLSAITELYSFCQKAACRDGAIPIGGLWPDPAGNFYGTTQFGGAHGQGTIFELSHGKIASNSQWTETVLYSFCTKKDCKNGAIPEAGLIGDEAGNLYGTASAGGGGDCQGSSPGCGVIFELAADHVTYSVLHRFVGDKDGAMPQAPLIINNGNLYGTTDKGGHGKYCISNPVGCGTVFMVSLATNAYSVLHRFQNKKHPNDGAQPQGSLLLYNGFLYGATLREGGKCNCGTLFRLPIG